MLVGEMAAGRFAGSHDAHLVHAFVAEQAGKFDIAIAAARRALAIDANSRQARSLLERLEKAR